MRAKLDDRDQLRPGLKYAEWELKGVPLRLEVGPKDVANGETRMANRATGEKQQMKVDETPRRLRRTSWTKIQKDRLPARPRFPRAEHPPRRQLRRVQGAPR